MKINISISWLEAPRWAKCLFFDTMGNSWWVSANPIQGKDGVYTIPKGAIVEEAIHGNGFSISGNHWPRNLIHIH